MRATTLLSIAVLGLVGCGPTCKQSCGRLFGIEPGECTVIGTTNAREVTESCIELCRTRDELSRPPPIDTVEEWQDCVAEHSCEELDDGVCPLLGFGEDW